MARHGDRPLTERRWYMILMVFLCSLGVGIGNVLWTDHVDKQREESERKREREWCALLSTLDSPQAPPTTERGRVIAEELRRLRTARGC